MCPQFGKFNSKRLLDLSYNILKQSQINAVVVQREKMDRVGVEPTTSAMSAFSRLFSTIFDLKGRAGERYLSQVTSTFSTQASTSSTISTSSAFSTISTFIIFFNFFISRFFF